MQILDGKKTAAEIRGELKEKITARKKEGTRPPALAVIIAGDNPASQVYVRNKQKACEEIGIVSIPYILPEATEEKELLKLIEELNSREDVDGILLQLPLPVAINAQKCLITIDPEKDVDGFHPLNVGRLALGLDGFQPCTPAGIMLLLERYKLNLKGKKAVILGRSDIVGKPLSLLLSQKGVDATVTICHSATKNLAKECREADFLFLAIGSPRAITGEMISPGCVVVDVGINRTDSGLCGDGDFESLKEKAGAITPVPGGIGPMTIAMLLVNTVKSWQQRLKI